MVTQTNQAENSNPVTGTQTDAASIDAKQSCGLARHQTLTLPPPRHGVERIALSVSEAAPSHELRENRLFGGAFQQVWHQLCWGRSTKGVQIDHIAFAAQKAHLQAVSTNEPSLTG